MTESRLQHAMREKLLSRLGAFDQDDDNGRRDNQAQRRRERRGA